MQIRLEPLIRYDLIPSIKIAVINKRSYKLIQTGNILAVSATRTLRMAMLGGIMRGGDPAMWR
jgi:hypothetical protein